MLLSSHFRKMATLTFLFRCISGAAELRPLHQDVLRWSSGVLMLAVGLYHSTSPSSAAYQPFCSPKAFTVAEGDLMQTEPPRNPDLISLYRIGGEFYCLSAEG